MAAAATRRNMIEVEDDEPLLDDVQGERRSDTLTRSADTGIKRRYVRARTERFSDTLYGDNEGDPEFYGQSTDVKKIRAKQSKRLPPWIWFIIAKSLGIKVNEFDRPWFGTLMYIITVLFAILFSMAFIWYTVYDIINIYTKQTVLTGIVAISMCVYWCSLGIYANHLAAKLFSCQKFVDSVRLHSKTIFKVSAVGIMILLALTITVINSYSSAQTFSDSNCRNISLTPVVCKIMFVSRVGFSIFSAVWNLLVGTVLLSVCRTHTIGIRRFIRELDQDGRLYELFYKRNLARHRTDADSDTEEDFLWDNNDISPLTPDYSFPGRDPPPPLSSASLPTTPTRRQARTNSLNSPRPSPPKNMSQNANYANPNPNPQQSAGTTHPERQSSLNGQPMTIFDEDLPTSFAFPPPGGTAELDALPGATSSGRNGNQGQLPPQRPMKPLIIVKADSLCIQEEEGAEEGGGEGEGRMGQLQVQGEPTNLSQCSNSSQVDSPQHSLRVELNSPRKVPSSIEGLENDQESASNFSLGPRGLTNDDILQRYWQIQVRLRQTSIALQRWLMAWVSFILIWAVSFLVYWVSHEATLLGIADFFLPILLLPLLTAAYGEVNYEGKRMLKCICPTEERLHLLYFLQQQPLELNSFGFNISYSTIVTALGALGLAFCSKIMLDELNLKAGI